MENGKMKYEYAKGKDQFYYQGKYFDELEPMLQWAKDWQLLPLDEETADKQLNTVKKDILMNVILRGIQCTNVEFKEYVEKIFIFAMNEMDLLSNETNLRNENGSD